MCVRPQWQSVHMMHIIYQLLIATILSGSAISQTYYIAPENSLYGSSNNTISLELLISQNQFYGGENLTLVFLPGNHFLTSSLTVQSFMFVDLIGENDSVIMFSGRNSLMEFSTIGQLNIENLSFTSDIVGFTSERKLTINYVTNFSISGCFFSGFNGTSRPTLLYTHRTESTSIDYVRFENNLALAIHIRSGNQVIITHCVFERNWNSARSGGAIRVDSTMIVVSECKFFQNIASYGGAICIYPQSNYVSITDTELTDNSATHGGAIYIYRQTNMSVSNTLFESNNASKDGGGIYAYRFSDINITDSELTNNTATWGGAIAIYRQTNLSVSNTSFGSNNASKEGGGIYAEFSDIINITDSELTNNSADSWGGGIFLYSPTNVHITKTVITGNRGNPWGGGIFTELGNIYISESELTSNNADYGAPTYSYSSVSISDSNITNNVAKAGVL